MEIDGKARLKQPQYFIMRGKKLIPVDYMEAAKYMGTAEHHVAYTSLLGNTVHVSTVFLCINRNLYGEGKPVLFETMVFGGGFDGYQERYTSYRKAVKGHVEAIKFVLLNQ